ncbi:hypothetical protein NHX12_029976 [Muraenolepis orangiensis]|uniref:Ig-like domain-containing protein n=1 Tax=Muraenolepis orangiensis TaxID=630683 RepID=A0A9Q0IIZ8_9TELE|nr:hypothetical protein NHX12_029976 [Muraenolepis orangiensis]
MGAAMQSPVFSKQPGSIVYPLEAVEKNREVMFSCEAQGKPPAVYRWKLNGTVISVKSSGSHYSLSGGNLRISHLNKDHDAGTYQCLASNSLGTIVSREASLTFACPPLIQHKDGSRLERRGGPYLQRNENPVILAFAPPASDDADGGA